MSLDRKPWAFGEEDFHLLYRYSCLHSHFQSLQYVLRRTFTATGTLPYHYDLAAVIRGFGGVLSPVIFTARGNLTSELLRFL
jgi:hypothetical protein